MQTEFTICSVSEEAIHQISRKAVKITIFIVDIFLFPMLHYICHEILKQKIYQLKKRGMAFKWYFGEYKLKYYF